MTGDERGLYIGSVVINVAEVARAREFWCAALGYAPRDNGDDTFLVLHDPERPWANVSLQRSAEPKRGRNRLHLDLYASDQAAEVERLLSLGATRPVWDYPVDADFVVLADPDGNEFCVIAHAASGGAAG